MCVFVHVGACVHGRTHIYIYTHTRAHTCMGAHTHVCIHVCAYIQLIVSPYLPNPSAQAGYDTRSIFKQSLTGLNSEFSFS